MPYVTSIERMAKQEGLEEGWQKGQQEGWQKGQQEGWQKGQQEGWQKGQIRSLQSAILRVLQARFTAIPDSLRAALQQTQDAGTLDNYLQQAAICPDIGSFKLLGQD